MIADSLRTSQRYACACGLEWLVPRGMGRQARRVALTCPRCGKQGQRARRGRGPARVAADVCDGRTRHDATGTGSTARRIRSGQSVRHQQPTGLDNRSLVLPTPSPAGAMAGLEKTR
jgi:hypothetical protein